MLVGLREIVEEKERPEVRGLATWGGVGVWGVRQEMTGVGA